MGFVRFSTSFTALDPKRKMMRVLVACEVSGIVRDAFAARGHDAWSCDIKPAQLQLFSAPGPVKHLQRDVLQILNDGWDLLIAHPPCTYLSWVGNAFWNDPGREFKRDAAQEFFMRLLDAPIARRCIENPLGCISQLVPHDQIIHPYYHGDPFMKRTCLWLRGLPRLVDTNRLQKPAAKYIGPDGTRYNFVDGMSGTAAEKQNKRSQTFPGIAAAMASQWG